MSVLAGPPPLHLRTTRVLIADDHDVIRTGLGHLVASQPDLMVVGTASDGRSAVQLALTGAPDVVVMDLAMPNLDGVAATREILMHVPDVRVLVLTGLPDQAMARAALEAGACRCLNKAGTAADVLDAIRTAVTHGADQPQGSSKETPRR